MTLLICCTAKGEQIYHSTEREKKKRICSISHNLSFLTYKLHLSVFVFKSFKPSFNQEKQIYCSVSSSFSNRALIILIFVSQWWIWTNLIWNCHPSTDLEIFSHTEMDKLQWGNRKRLRCVKVKDSSLSGKSDGGGSGGGIVKKKITSRVVDNNINNSSKDGHALPPVPSPHRPNRELGMSRSIANDNRKASSTSLSPEKEDKYYTTRGSGGFDDGSKALFANPKEENRNMVWPKLLISLSSKEKEEDFMMMKGCKPPQRPKKRAKLIQRTILLVSPGSWLTDLCQERYEVREKKTSKKKPRGLKAMGSMESDSE